MNGRQRAVYYNTAQNGWISIITVPYRTILEDLRRLTFWFSILFGIFLLFTVLVAVREYRLNRDINRTNETVRVLGNSYYAIYRIDFGKATYDMIKGSDYIRSRLPRKGDYEKFLRASGEVIEKNAYQEFIETFSLENIRALVAKRTRDFGGDFLRFVNVDLRDDGLALVFFCNFLNERCDHFARAAPCCKKVYKNKLVIADQCVEIFSCGMYDCHGNFLLKMIWHYTKFV